ncbi:hypothetical protein BUALT_Bualt05G0030000 [Buddleja alternifolia]|uniref:Nucleotide-diphospho-sugar transferase domain-containing protein n=1 Tax=Buddleja alternifolia TaxID=168488 RepID=A0AAV6XN43_9LAMI|nr:hypothetical protein BUALT_Bualt05G0030000 [Buddleja alternifolia]
MDFRDGGSNHRDDEKFLDSDDYHHKNHHNSTNQQPHRHHSSSVAIKTTLLFVVIALTCIVLSQTDYPSQLLHRSYSFSTKRPSSSTNAIEKKIYSSSDLGSRFHEFESSDGLPPHLESFDGEPPHEQYDKTLEKTLRKAAMKDHKTVILTTLNAAWTEPNSIFDLFLESFRIGNQTQNLLKHLVVVALDQKAYARCLDVHPHCYALTTTGVDFSSQAFFMSGDYLKMMWRRIDFLRIVLEMGFDFVFSDADIMWFRDPFPRFYPDADFQIACDQYKYNSTDIRNHPNGGFNYVKSNNRTIHFYKFWYTGKDYFPGKHDQDVLNMIKYNPFIAETGLKIRFLDTAYFGGFCEPSKDLDQVITMHANCCVGLDNKIHDIKMVIADWKKYMSLLPHGGKNFSTRSWTSSWRCGMKKSST